jgi:ribonuclease HI
MYSSFYLGFVDSFNHHTWNMASVTWVIYSPEYQLVSSGGVHLETSTNNVAEYRVVIELLRDAISHGVQYLEVFLDS